MKRWIHASIDLSNMSKQERMALAWDTDDPEIMWQLADDEDWEVRSNLIKHHYKPVDEDILWHMSDNESRHTRMMVAWKTKDPELVRKLADDEDPSVRREVAEYGRKIAPDVIDYLAYDESPEVQTRIAVSTDDPEVLDWLADKVDIEDEMYGDGLGYTILNNIVANPDTSIQTLQKLARNSNPRLNYLREDAIAELRKRGALKLTNQALFDLCKELASEIIITENTNSVHDMYYDLSRAIEDSGYKLTKAKQDKVYDWVANGKLDQYFQFTY